MKRAFLRWLTGWCEWHDVAWPVKTAQLEESSGINPNAVAELHALGPLVVETFADPDIVDCGSARCRRRRGLTA